MIRSVFVLSLCVALSGCDKGSDAAPKEAKADDAKADEAKPEETKSDETKSDGTKSADAEAGDEPSVDITPAKADEDAWMDFESTEHEFAAKFPAAPSKEDAQVPSPAGNVPATMFMASKGDTQFVGATVLSVPKDILAQFDVERGLNGARDGMLNNVGATIVSEKHIQFAGHDTRAVVGKVTRGTLTMRIEARILWVRPRMYSLIAVVPEDTPPAMANKFFDSFSLASGH